MIEINAHYLVVILTFFASVLSSEITHEDSPKINVDEKFKEAIVLPSGYSGTPKSSNNYVHQGTNFFFYPHFLLGNQILLPPSAVIASIETNNEIEDNIKLKNGENRTVDVKPPQDLHKMAEITVEEKYNRSVVTELPVLVSASTESTTNALEANSTAVHMQKENIKEVIEPHDIIIVSDILQPVLKPDITVRQHLLTIPEAPVLPPLVLPELPVKVSIEETIPVPVKMTSISESELYIPIDSPNVPLLTEPNVYRPFITEADYTINKITTPQAIVTGLLSNLPLQIYISKNKTVVLIPTPSEVPSIVTRFPTSALCAHTIVAERVIPNIFKFSEKTTTKSVEMLPIPLTYNIPV